MLSLKHILVAADFSPISIVALRHALGIARRYHSNVSLLHVIDPSIYGAAGPDGISADTECAMRDAERIEAGLRADGSLEGLKFDLIVEVGPVWRTIAETIEDKRSAALVLGTHGRTGLQQAGAGLCGGARFPGSAVSSDDRWTESVSSRNLAAQKPNISSCQPISLRNRWRPCLMGPRWQKPPAAT